jgi:hypothetical protein
MHAYLLHCLYEPLVADQLRLPPRALRASEINQKKKRKDKKNRWRSMLIWWKEFEFIFPKKV